MSKVSDIRDDQLERKLQLMLGSKVEWLAKYADWCAGNDIPKSADGYLTPDAYDDHNVNLFVRQQREAKSCS